MNEERANFGKGPVAERSVRKEPLPPEAQLDAASAAQELTRFLEILVRATHCEIEYEVKVGGDGEKAADEPGVVVAFRGADQDLLLQHNADLLLAIEHIAHRWLRLDPRLHDQVRFDCGDYRASRLEELKLSARVAAQRVRETGQAFPFNPMSSRERRIIHLELNGAPGVRTVSEGSGDRRHLVIYPATKK
jgi:spoIIIJ-associated protein